MQSIGVGIAPFLSLKAKAAHILKYCAITLVSNEDCMGVFGGALKKLQPIKACPRVHTHTHTPHGMALGVRGVAHMHTDKAPSECVCALSQKTLAYA